MSTEEFDNTVLVGDFTEGSRKRVYNKRNLRARRKEIRYRDSDPVLLAFIAPCAHKTKRYSCCTIPLSDLIAVRQKIYSKYTKIEQDRLLSYLIRVSPTNRSRPALRPKTKPRSAKQFSVQYFIPIQGGKRKPVCAKFFQKLFNIAQTRVNTIAKSVFSGDGVIEKRGGNHKIHLYGRKRQAVIEFLSKLKGTQSHYNRKKSKRIYLSSSLSIKKLFDAYNNEAEQELKVKRTFFNTVFCRDFNIGFGKPAVDVCSYCKRMKFTLKTEKNVEKKNEIMVNLRAHKLRAKTFYKLLKHDPVNSITMCFDLQQIHPLPKLNIGEAYYARQINFYSFCIFVLNDNTPTFFTWDETQAGKGSVEISSAVLSLLQTYNFEQTITCLRLFCDGCGGQNKNMHIVHALSWWLYTRSPSHLQEIVLFFPIRGHSYLPPDRVFGVVEKELKKKEEIITREEYESVYAGRGEVKCLGTDWKILDVKAFSSCMKKMDGIRDAKRIYIKKTILRNKRTRQTKLGILIKMENFYMAETGKKYATIMKQGYKIENIPNPQVIENSFALTDTKKKDIEMVLNKRYGAEWRNIKQLTFYKTVIDNSNVNNEQDNEEVMCDCLEEEEESRLR